MISFELTNDAENLLKLLYSLYVCRASDGKDRTKAKQFGSSEDIKADFLDQMSHDDVFDLCMELEYAGCIIGILGDDALNEISLTDDAIIYGEQTFKRNVHDLAQWLAGLKGFLPL